MVDGGLGQGAGTPHPQWESAGSGPRAAGGQPGGEAALGRASLPLEHNSKPSNPIEERREGGQPMAGQRFTTVGLVTVVLAVIVPVADEGRVRADACRALELSWAALELSC